MEKNQHVNTHKNRERAMINANQIINFDYYYYY